MNGKHNNGKCKVIEACVSKWMPFGTEIMA
jgi:hypothetical protein